MFSLLYRSSKGCDFIDAVRDLAHKYGVPLVETVEESQQLINALDSHALSTNERISFAACFKTLRRRCCSRLSGEAWHYRRDHSAFQAWVCAQRLGRPAELFSRPRPKPLQALWKKLGWCAEAQDSSSTTIFFAQADDSDLRRAGTCHRIWWQNAR